jgi:hypothetical protein
MCALTYFVQMQFINMYIMANGVKSIFVDKIRKKTKEKKLYIFLRHVILSQHVMTNYNL